MPMPMPASVSPEPIKVAFNPLIKPYLVLYIGAVLVLTVVLIPLALIWFCGIGQWWARHYFKKLECELGPVALRFRKGILARRESLKHRAALPAATSPHEGERTELLRAILSRLDDIAALRRQGR